MIHRSSIIAQPFSDILSGLSSAFLRVLSVSFWRDEYGTVNVFEQTFLLWLGSLAAGFLGAMTGLGGGVVLVPLLTLVFHVDLRYAIGASLVSVIATSSGSA